MEIVVQYSCYQDEHLISANLEHLYGFADRIVISFGAFRGIRKIRVLWGLPESGEWVDDCYTAARGAVGVAESVSQQQRRVMRGGSWICYPTYLRCAKREHQAQDYRSRFAGYRCAR